MSNEHDKYTNVSPKYYTIWRYHVLIRGITGTSRRTCLCKGKTHGFSKQA